MRLLALVVLPVACLLAAGTAGADSVIRFNEIMYHPAGNEAELEWLELFNSLSYDMDISGWRLEEGVEFTMPPGTVIPAEGYLVVASSPSGLAAETGFGEALGPFSGRLSNGGETLRLINNSGRLMDAVAYGAGGEWPAAADGSGVSLVKIRADTASAPPENWSWGAQVGGSPGTASRVHPANGLAFNEVASATASNFWVELVNGGAGPIDLTGYVLACAGTGAGTYVFPARSIAAGGYAVVDESALGFRAYDEDKLFLYTADIRTVVDAAVVKVSHRGRYPDGTGRWLHPDGVTTGAANHFAFHDEIVINEIMYHHQPLLEPYQESPEEWIELYNRGTGTVSISGWRLTEAVDYTFPAGTLMPPGAYFVAAWNPDAMLAQYPALTNRLFGPFAGGLANDGERIVLMDEAGNPADEVRYCDGGRWPRFADGGGSSLELRDPDADNSIAEAWAPSDESGKSAWRTYAYTNRAAASAVGPDGQWHETVLGLLTAGEILLDNISVIENPGGAAVQFVQNGSFQSDTVGAMPGKWRIIGTHRHSEVVADPANGANKVLRLVATGPTEHMHNHAETTHAGGKAVVNGRDYAISFKAKWIAGSRQLNTRLYFNRCARTTILDAPLANGTPGAVNSTYATNLGPTYAQFMHGPAVPAAFAPVTVSVTARDPDGVAAMTNWYCVNEGTWVAAAMTDQGNGRYAATIPGQAASALVQFYVEGRDSLGAVSTFPAAGINSSALYRHDDGQAAVNGLHNFRVVMKDSDQTWLHALANVMSDDSLGCTVIYKEEEIYYNAGARLKGAMRGRWYAPTAGYNIEFNADQPFLGAHETVRAERSEEPSSKRRREILLKLVMNHAGATQSAYNDLVQLIAPNPAYNNVAELQLAGLEDEFLDSQIENGADGMLFKQELIYYPTTTDGGPEGNKLPAPNNVLGADIRDLGDDKENYRWNYLILNNRVRDDYTDLILFCKVFGQGNPSFNEQAGAVADVDQWLRWCAAVVTDGAGDNYIQTAVPHNSVFYARPRDGKMLLFPIDLDYDWQWNRPLVSACPPLVKLIADPGNERLYYGHMLDIITHAYNPGYMTHWIEQFAGLDPAAPWASYLSHIGDRGNFLLGQLAGRTAPAFPFRVTTSGGDVASDVITVAGEGWIDLYEIRVEGMDAPLELTWTGSGSGTGRRFFWRASVPLEPGPNNLVFIAYDYQGNVLGSESVSFNCTVAERPLRDHLRVTEVMYNPRLGSDYEFIEFHNTGANALDLAHVRITDGVTFDFAASPVTNLAAGAYVVVVSDLAAFRALYDTRGFTIAGQYEGQLANGGEIVRIRGQWNALVFDFAYSDARGWPLAADGAGHSLVPLVMDGQETGALDYGGNWRASAFIDGSPGRADPSPVVDVVLNEFAAHTDTDLAPPYDSDDWTELYAVSNVTLTDWYLSDDGDDLKRYRIPDGTLIPAGGRLRLTEILHFHTNRLDGSGFGLNKAGEQIFLSHLPGTAHDRVVDAVRFKGQENGVTLGRAPDGGAYWYALSPTPNASNAAPAAHVLIGELMYHPPTAGSATNNTRDEYIEIWNPLAVPVDLWTEAGPWRIDGAVAYTFPSNTTISAKSCLVLVPFDPERDAAALTAFLAAYSLTNGHVRLLGPWAGTLDNRTERVALENPQAPDAPGEPVSWIIADEVIYFDGEPWPALADGSGLSLHKMSITGHGRDPANWIASPPTPGAAPDAVVISWPLPYTTAFLPLSGKAQAAVATDLLTPPILRVTFTVGTNPVGVDTTAPYEQSLDVMTQPGEYELRAVLEDGAGAHTSQPVVVAAMALADGGVSGIADYSAGLSCALHGPRPGVVELYWGQSDGGTNRFAWEHATSVGTVSNTTVRHEVRALQPDTSNAYRWRSEVNGVECWTPVAGVLHTTAARAAGDWLLPFVEDFEGLLPGDLPGQYGWLGTNAAVQSEVTYGGSAKAGRLTTETGALRHPIGGGETDVWTDVRVQPVFASVDNASVTNLPAGSSFAFYVSTNGQVVAYDGTTATQLMHAALTEGEWVRFSVHSDYAAKTWDLYVNGALAAESLGFYDRAASAYTEFGMRGAGELEAIADEITIGTDEPAGIDRELPDFLIGGITLTEGGPGGELRVGLSWAAQSGRLYRVWWSDDLLTGWPSGQVFTTRGGDWIDPGSAVATQRFYRVTTEPVP